MAMKISILLFCVVSLCSLEDLPEPWRGLRFHETSVATYRPTPCSKPEDLLL